ncbi:hypothetical protein GCM10011611_38250 [Aliidongia dinghuensis]|uniref:Flagellar protein FliL n=1 Tax=Aliidongia dinghuensis TaxID=1867774 RepID=A0A8J3E399_9PROT|nr:hypothetical protein [Aliidongia dinghuensis]GGF28523.1 hypothetical protein GCM10011611_38250 [Aliidongia dinghuensis]
MPVDRLLRCLVLILAVALFSPAPAARAAEGASADPNAPVFVRTQGVAFSVIGANNKIQKEVQLAFSLELEKGKLEAALDPFKRRLQDAYLIAMSDLWESRPADAPPVSGEEIKAKLMQVTTEITGPGLVKDILLQGIGERSHVR